MNPSMYKRLNVNVPWDDYSKYQHYAISDRTTVSKMIRAVLIDEPMIRELRGMISQMKSLGESRPMIKPDSIRPEGNVWIWEYLLPSGRKAEVIKTDSGLFLSH